MTDSRAQTEAAIEAAFKAQVGDLYRALALALLDAADDPGARADAEARFSNGLVHARDALNRALELAR